MVASVNAFDFYGANAPDDDLVNAPIGSFYRQVGTSIIWYKYGAQNYNWRPYSLDPSNGLIGPGFNADAESSALSAAFQTAGGGTATINTGLAGRVSIATMTVTSTVTPDRARWFNMGGGNPTNGITPGGGKIYLFSSIAFTTISDAVDAVVVRTLGSDGIASVAPANGIWLENDRNVHGTNNWQLRAADNTVITAPIDLGVAPVNGVFQKLGIVVEADGLSARAMINDVRVGQIVAGLPSGGRGFALLHQLVKTLGIANPRSIQVDYAYAAILCAAGR